MAGKLTLRLGSGQQASITLADAALDDLGVGPEAVFDGDNMVVSRHGIQIDSPHTDKAGRLRYEPSPVGRLTWADCFDRFAARINVGKSVVALGGDLAVAAIAAWCRECEKESARPRRRGRPANQTGWSDRDELIAAIAIRSNGDDAKVVAAIRALLRDEPTRFRDAFPAGTDEQRLEAARRAFYRAFARGS